MNIIMALYRHRKLLYFRQIKHILYMRRVNRRIATLNYIRSEQQSYLSLDQLEDMTAQARRELRQRNPEFPPTMFMTAEEKEHFFEETGCRFIEQLEKSKQRECKSKKIVKFIGRVQHYYDPNSQILDDTDWA